jgi:hypothetical protein
MEVEVKKLEHLGAGLSLVCAAHCALMPALVAALPLVGHEMEHLFHAHGLESAIIGIAGAIGYLTLGFGFRRHGRVGPLVVLTLGLLLLVGGHALLSEEIARLPAFVGALMLAGAQLWNRRQQSGCCPGARA